MNEKHQSCVYADDINILGKNLQTFKENTEIFKKACKDISLGVNSKKNFYHESVLVLDCSVVKAPAHKAANLGSSTGSG